MLFKPAQGTVLCIFKVGLFFLLHVAELRYCTEMSIVADQSAEMEDVVQH